MEIIVLSLVLVVLILLFIRINMLNQNIDVLMCRVDNVNDSIDIIEEDLKTIKENINKLENLCASISSNVNNGFSKILNDKNVSISLEMTRNIIKDGFNTQSKDLYTAANMLNNNITNISDSMAAAHKELMHEIKANKTPKPKATKNTNKEKKGCKSARKLQIN